MPVVTGQDAEVPSVKSIIAGEQTSTVFKDTRELAKVTVDMVDAVLAGGKPEVNDTKTYDNGVKVVPSYLLKPVSVDKSNWKQVADRQRLLQGRPVQVSCTRSWTLRAPARGSPSHARLRSPCRRVDRGTCDERDPRDARHHQDASRA